MKFMKPHVFLNFRGVEVRKTFGSHLLSSFKTKCITSFIASEPFEALDHEAMEKSHVAIPVISTSYVISDRWVEDLSRIIECEKIGTLTVIPIFFQVNPLDIVRHTAGKYANVQIETLEMVRKWLYAQVSRKPSFHSNDWEDDSELLDKLTSVVSDILISCTSSYHSTEVSPAPSLKVESAFGFADDLRLRSLVPIKLKFLHTYYQTRFREHVHLGLKRHLENMRADSKLAGICGIEGVGKTTIAKALYEEISPEFQHHVYISNKGIGKWKLPSSVLKIFFPSEDFKGSRSSDDGIKEMIGHRKVLLVVDGVGDIKQLKGVIKDASWFGPGSRTIVITQDRSLLTQCGVKNIYEVDCPSYEEALCFFSEFAFKQSNPLPGFEGLSYRAVHVANRLPLSLKMLGSFLYDKDKDEWVDTLRRLEASRESYASEVNRYIGADDYAPRRPIKVDRHIGVDEANCFPLYCLPLE